MASGEEILAVRPRRTGTVIHLWRPGYRPGKKTRSLGDHAALCNYLVHHEADRVPLKVALAWDGTDPWGGPLTWCRMCIGHALNIRGVTERVVTYLAHLESEGTGSL